MNTIQIGTSIVEVLFVFLGASRGIRHVSHVNANGLKHLSDVSIDGYATIEMFIIDDPL